MAAGRSGVRIRFPWGLKSRNEASALIMYSCASPFPSLASPVPPRPAGPRRQPRSLRPSGGRYQNVHTKLMRGRSRFVPPLPACFFLALCQRVVLWSARMISQDVSNNARGELSRFHSPVGSHGQAFPSPCPWIPRNDPSVESISSSEPHWVTPGRHRKAGGAEGFSDLSIKTRPPSSRT